MLNLYLKSYLTVVYPLWWWCWKEWRLFLNLSEIELNIEYLAFRSFACNCNSELWSSYDWRAHEFLMFARLPRKNILMTLSVVAWNLYLSLYHFRAMMIVEEFVSLTAPWLASRFGKLISSWTDEARSFLDEAEQRNGHDRVEEWFCCSRNHRWYDPHALMSSPDLLLSSRYRHGDEHTS